MAAKSSTFYRLEKAIGDGYTSIVDFHTVVNGNTYYKEHEKLPSGRLGWIGNIKMCSKESGNKYYKRLKSIGYKLTGIYEMDIFGHETLKERR